MNKVANKWVDYQIIDAGNKEKLEMWNGVVLRRPDPQAIWPINENIKLWKNNDAHYHRSNKGGGSWDYKKKLPPFWTVSYRDLTFKVSPTDFKHTGLFPEQASNWDWMMDAISNSKKDIKVLNLFAYTGGATMACSYAGATEVVHVDAAKGMVAWAKENMKLSKLENNHIRFIVDDCLKFVEREKRRGNTYQAIIMDPPSYGRGPNNELWKLEDSLLELITKSIDLLDDKPLFFLVNAYTTGLSSTVLSNVLKKTIATKYPHGTVETGEVGLPIQDTDLILPCGIYGRWLAND